jgi:hypothetical protein
LELLEEVIEWLGKRHFHDFFEIESCELRLSVSLSLHLEGFSECDHIIHVIGRLTVYRGTRMGTRHEELTGFIDTHVE